MPLNLLKWASQAKDLGYSALSQASNSLGAGAGFVRSAIGGSWLFGSTETSHSYSDAHFDEKHYFLIPDRRSESEYSLYVMRCLPEGVPPINDLPKQRLFHLPNEHAMPTVEHIMVSKARETAVSAPQPTASIGTRLNEIADQVDRLDHKVFNGVLLIGGLVALINPLAGAAVAAKALLPSVGLLLSKYGLKYVGDAANELDVAKRIKTAEQDVLRQFRDSSTTSVVNPILAQLDRALGTSEYEYDPILEFRSEDFLFGDRDGDRMLNVTCQAISNTYQDALDDESVWPIAQLGPEDVRYLKLLRALGTSQD